MNHLNIVQFCYVFFCIKEVSQLWLRSVHLKMSKKGEHCGLWCQRGNPDIFHWLLSNWTFCFCIHRNAFTGLSILETEAARSEWSRHFSSWASQRTSHGWCNKFKCLLSLSLITENQIKMYAILFKNMVFNSSSFLYCRVRINLL